MGITIRENMLRVFNHEVPEFLPLIADIQNIATVEPGYQCVIEATGEPGDYEVDWFGQGWIFESKIKAYNPDVNNYIIKNLGDWSKYLTIPKLDEIDWEAKFDAEEFEVDRENKFILIKDQVGLWERAFCTTSTMDLFCALIDEPEACEDFFRQIADHKIKLHNRYITHYKPDALCMHDDYGSGTGLFMSPETWRELIKPHLQRVIDNITSQGVMYEHHCCGVLEPIAEEIAEMGTAAWENVHVSNDPVKCKQVFGDKLAFIGGLFNSQYLDSDGVTDDQVRNHVRKTMEEILPGVGSVPYAAMKAHPERSEIINEELLTYGQTFFSSNRPDNS